MPASSKRQLKTCSNKVKTLDGFGQPFMFHLPEGQKTKQAWSGVAATVIIILLIIFYGLI